MGISNYQQMLNADIIWGVVLNNGTPVIVDRFAQTNPDAQTLQPLKDARQDVFVLPEGCSGTSSYISLSSSSNDYSSQKSMGTLRWSFEESSILEIHWTSQSRTQRKYCSGPSARIKVFGIQF